MFTMAQPSPSTTKAKRPEWLIQFGRRLRLARGRAGLTQQSLGVPDLSKSFISLLESGRSYPSVETVVSLARRTRASVASLLLDPAELKLETAMNLLHLAAQQDPLAHGAEALQLTAAAEALLPDMPADLLVRAALIRARVAMWANRLDEGTRWADEAVAVATRHRLGGAVGRALGLKGTVEVWRGMFRDAVPTLEKAVEVMRRTKTARTEENVWALLSLGTARFRAGEIDRAQRAYRRALDVASRLRTEKLQGRALMGLGMVEWTRQRLDQAVEFLGKAYDAFEQVEDLAEMSRTLTNLGLVRREQGLYAEALAVLERTLRLKERLGDVRGRSATLDEMAQVLLAMNRLADAARAARRAIKNARSVDDRAREAAGQFTLARVLRARGRRQEAIDLLRTAVDTFTRLGMQSHAVTASGELGLMLKDARADAEAATYLKRALRARDVRETTPALPTEGLLV
ncbi:MAG: tetratricopeptide repeat protein [Armatimonadetes bacterium]|nr:tetratricopeptide repeat protein [Armatimonadota bacterium]